jgi:hypothetical protein
MNIKSASCVIFSSIRTTRAIIQSIAEGMKVEKIIMMDCTNRSVEKGPL